MTWRKTGPLRGPCGAPAPLPGGRAGAPSPAPFGRGVPVPPPLAGFGALSVAARPAEAGLFGGPAWRRASALRASGCRRPRAAPAASLPRGPPALRGVGVGLGRLRPSLAGRSPRLCGLPPRVLASPPRSLGRLRRPSAGGGAPRGAVRGAGGLRPPGGLCGPAGPLPAFSFPGPPSRPYQGRSFNDGRNLTFDARHRSTSS